LIGVIHLLKMDVGKKDDKVISSSHKKDKEKIVSLSDEVILVLAMFNSDRVFKDKEKGKGNKEEHGQERRDQKRINALIKRGFRVYSLDDKHKQIIGRHCYANFNYPRKMMRSLNEQRVFPSYLGARFIILDYFFCPVI